MKRGRVLLFIFIILWIIVIIHFSVTIFSEFDVNQHTKRGNSKERMIDFEKLNLNNYKNNKEPKENKINVSICGSLQEH